MNSQPTLFDQPAVIERDKGLKKVSDNNSTWLEQCLDLFPFYYQNTFTGEDIRHFYEKRGLTPCHSNAFGALIMTLIKRKLIVETGEYRQMTSPKSHARKTPVYKKV